MPSYLYLEKFTSGWNVTPLRASFILGELLNNCQPHLYRKGPDLLYLLSPLLQKLWCLSLPPIGTMLFFSDTIPHLRPPVTCESFWALSSECTLLAQYITQSPNLPPIICVVDNFVYLKSDSEFLISCLYLPSYGIIGMYLPCLVTGIQSIKCRASYIPQKLTTQLYS